MTKPTKPPKTLTEKAYSVADTAFSLRSWGRTFKKPFQLGKVWASKTKEIATKAYHAEDDLRPAENLEELQDTAIKSRNFALVLTLPIAGLILFLLFGDNSIMQVIVVSIVLLAMLFRCSIALLIYLEARQQLELMADAGNRESERSTK